MWTKTAALPACSKHLLPVTGLRSDIKSRLAVQRSVNCPPFVRQYGILNNKCGALLCQSERRVLSMITTILTQAFATISDETGLILHSDQGWQYQHKQYQCILKCTGIRQSMSRKGNHLNNAVIETSFGLFKSELLYLQKFQSMAQSKQELIDYLDYHNNKRIETKSKGLPSAIHRQQALSAARTIFIKNYCLTFWGNFIFCIVVSPFQ